MVKNKALWSATLAFFLIIQTVYFWEGKIGLFALPIIVGLCIFYLILFFLLIQQLVLLTKKKFKEKHRIYISSTLAIVLISTAFFLRA